MKQHKIPEGYKFSFANQPNTDFSQHPSSTPKFKSIEVKQKAISLPSPYKQKGKPFNDKQKKDKDKFQRSKFSKSTQRKVVIKVKKNQYFSNSYSLQDLRNNVSLSPSHRIRREKSKKDQKNMKKKLIDLEEIKEMQKQLLQNTLKISGDSSKNHIELQLNQEDINEFSFSKFNQYCQESPKSIASMKFQVLDKNIVKNSYLQNKQIINSSLLPESTKSAKNNGHLFFRKKGNEQQKREKFHFKKMPFNRLKKRQPETIRLSELSYKIQRLKFQQL